MCVLACLEQPGQCGVSVGNVGGLALLPCRLEEGGGERERNEETPKTRKEMFG